MKQLTHMESAVEGLRASPPEALPFAPELDIRAFVLEREQGNILIYSTTGVQADDISRHYLNHRHEASFASDGVDAPLFVHERERDSVERAYHVRGTFSRRHTLDDDFEVIPTPGHTPGATAYLWDSGDHRFLFTGDTIYLDAASGWRRCSARATASAYIESLELIASSSSTCSCRGPRRAGPLLRAYQQHDTGRRIDAILERIRNGGDH